MGRRLSGRPTRERERGSTAANGGWTDGPTRFLPAMYHGKLRFLSRVDVEQPLGKNLGRVECPYDSGSEVCCSFLLRNDEIWSWGGDSSID